MKTNTLLLISIIFLVFGCKKKQEETKVEVSLVFDKSIVLPSSFFDLSEEEKNFYNQTLQDYKNIIPEQEIDEIFNYKERIIVLQKRIKTFFANQNISIQPMLDIYDTRKVYENISFVKQSTVRNCSNMMTPKGENLRPNLNNAAALGCLTIRGCDSIKVFLNKLGLGAICTVNCTSVSRISKLKDNLNKIDDDFEISCDDSDFNDFKKIMKINDLQLKTFDWGGKKWNFKGKNANLILVETSGKIDDKHFKFKGVNSDIWRKQENLGFGEELNHATWTFGVLFANNEQSFIRKSLTGKSKKQEVKNCISGISTDADVRKIVYYNGEDCGTRSKNLYGALLKAIIDAKAGDVLLLEMMLAGGKPIELDDISEDIISICTNILGITVIEPIGEDGGGIDLDKAEYARELPVEFGGIIVSSATKKNNKYIRSQEANYSKNHIDCFGLDNIQSTSTGNSFARYGLSSAAAAQIAGLALDMQSYYFSIKKCYLTPQQMKQMFKTANGERVEHRGKNGGLLFNFNSKIPNALNLKAKVDSLIRIPMVAPPVI
jgi:hypothetical protein